MKNKLFFSKLKKVRIVSKASNNLMNKPRARIQSFGASCICRVNLQKNVNMFANVSILLSWMSEF